MPPAIAEPATADAARPGTAPAEAAARWQRDEPEGPGPGGARWTLAGPWTFQTLGERFVQVEQALRRGAQDERWDLRGVTALDSAGAVLLWRAWGRRRPQRLQLQPEHQPLFAALALPASSAAPAAPRPGTPTDGGAAAGPRPLVHAAQELLEAVRLAGQLLLDALAGLRRPGRIAWREISANVYRAGAQALPITALVGFLVGVTLSYLTARQLKAFGADIFIVNILGIGVWRELGPLLAAVLVAGRSGSSMTAQLGVMRVTQELDALSVMGISHTARLVLPKVVALALAMPLVSVWTSLTMLLGGMIAARSTLGLDPQQFAQALPAAVPLANLLLGLGKSVGFGALIALVACHFGLRVKPDTQSLGEGTTASVVSAITAVIVLDAIAAVLFSNL